MRIKADNTVSDDVIYHNKATQVQPPRHHLQATWRAMATLMTMDHIRPREYQYDNLLKMCKNVRDQFSYITRSGSMHYLHLI